MGKDMIHKQCLGDKNRYADLLNGLLFGGRHEVHPCDLQEPDSPAVGKKQRDIVKKAACGAQFVVIGVENQEKVNYLMPFRSMLYDTLEYDRQARGIRKSIRNRHKSEMSTEEEHIKKISEEEYLSGFRKTDKLTPCITLVLYYGDEWDGGRELTDILDMSALPRELRKYVNSYPMHLFEVKKFSDADTAVFQTDLKQIFDFIRYSKDKEKLRALVENDPVYQEMDEDAYDMILAYTKDKRLLERKNACRKDGKIDMCQAIEEMCKDSWNEGVAQGIEQGMERGIEKGIEQGIEKGIEQGIEAFILDHREDGTPKVRVAEKLVRRFRLSHEKAEYYLVRYDYQ